MTKLIPASIIAVVSFLFFFFALPNYDAITARQEAITERENVLVDRQDLIKKIDDLNKKYQNNRANIAKIARIVPANKKMAELTAALLDITEKSGLTTEGFIYTDRIKRGEELGIVNVETDLVGNYRAFKSFLDLLEDNIRLSDIEEMRLQPESTEVTPDALKILISFNVYFTEE